MNVAIRADGGPSIGFGHLVRTGAVAKECLRRGDEVVYLTTTPDAVATSLPESITVEPLNAPDDSREVLRALDDHAIDTLFLDLFGADTTYQERLAKSDARIVVRHNYLNHTVCCDVLVYGDLHAPDLQYEWAGSKPNFLLGPEYILLREQFREIAQADPHWRDQPSKALVTMGGSDVSNSTPAVMEEFSDFSGTVDVVIGPGFSNAEEIEETASTVDTSFNLIYNPSNMAELMHRADLAVSAVGGTVFELLATRTPFVGIPQVENQLQRAKALREQGLAVIAADCAQVSHCVTALSTTETRRDVYERMDGIVDGKGAKRVSDSFCP